MPDVRILDHWNVDLDKDGTPERYDFRDNSAVHAESGKGLSSNDFTDEYKSAIDNLPTEYAPVNAQENVIEKISVNGTEQTVTDKKVNITVPTQASDIGAMPADTDLSIYAIAKEVGYDLGLSIDPTTYVMTLQLKNNLGTAISTKTIDFPIESMVVGASYKDGTLTLTLQSGSTVDVDISDIVSGLVNDNFTIAGIDMKDNITAAELKTALGVPSTFAPTDAEKNTIVGIKVNDEAVTVDANRIANIHFEADEVTKDSIEKALGYTPADEDDIPNVPAWALESEKPSYTASEVGALPADTHIPSDVTESTVSGWGFTKNTGTYTKPSDGIPKTDLAASVQTSLGKADTALQSYTETDPTVPSHVKAITSADITNWNNKMDKVTLADVATSGSYNDLDDKPTIPSAVTESTVSGWGFTKNTGSYSKPSTGIPKTDLASDVQTSLGKADTALQSVSKSDVGLGNVGNFKAVSTVASQGLTDTEKSNARTNIGLGSAATTDSTAYATSTQGGKADSAVQSVKIGTTEYKSGTTVTLPAYPTSLPADGGNADTVDNKHASDFMASTVTHLSGDVPTTRKVNNKALSSDITLTASDVGALPDTTTIPTKASDIGAMASTVTHLSGDIATSEKGANNGVATLDASGKVPSSQLPSYVDDVLEYTNKASFPTTGETGKIYVDKATNLTWRWSGSAYVEISPSLALGETSSTAYAGDKGKALADKLAGIASGAEVNVQSDWNVTDATSDAYIKNKPTIPSAVTESTVSGWGFTKNTGTYSKPSGGIPKTDLASAVQTSLGKADTALQSHQDISGKADKASITAGTAGTSSATSGSSLSVPYVTVNAQGIVTGYGTHTHTVSGFSTTDTKNTAGSTDTSSKIYLVGATSQGANPQTYSDNEVFATNGVLTTKSVQVGGGKVTLEYDTTNECLNFNFA